MGKTCEGCEPRDGAIIYTNPDNSCKMCGRIVYNNTNNRNLGECLDEANDIINGERQDQYGNPEDSFALIAEYWQTYINGLIGFNPVEYKLTSKDVAHMMILFKLARCSGQQAKRDNYVDLAGYASIVADRLL